MLIKNLIHQAMRTATASAMVFVWYLGPAMNAMAATDEERAAAFSAQVKASLLALEDGDRDAPRDHWDPQYVVDTVGIEPTDLYRWVHDSVVWMPYRGMLRGAEGVLMDRVGNSLDQSVLLATLLRLAGHDVRLAHAKLPEATVDILWDRLRAGRPAPGQALAPDSDSPEPQESQVLVTAGLYGIDRTSVAQIIDTTNAEAADLATGMAARISDQTTRLAEIVGPMDNGRLAGNVVDEARQSLADHWWVQVQRDGAWADLDLMAATDGHGEALAPAAETFDPASLPADVEQHVVIRVIAEQLKDSQLTEHVVLEQSVKPRELLGTTLGFRHFPMAWPEQWPQVTPDDIQIKLRAALYAQTEWLPVLVAGDAVLGTVGVFDTGELDPSPHPVNPFMQLTVSMMGQISKATDVLATGGDPDALLPADPSLDTPRPPRPEGELVAERLEYEVQLPGSEPRVISRDLFDLIGPAARAAGGLSGFTMSGQKALDRSMAMLGESEIQVLPSRLAPEFLTHLGAQNALGNRPVLDELARDPFGKLPANFMELFSKLNGLPAALYTLASLRFDVNPFSNWLYVDRPFIVAQHTRLARAGGGDFLAQVSLDIVENGVGVDPLAADNAATLRMSQGVADTNAEAVALQKVGTVSSNTADAFSANGPAGTGWVTLHPGDESLIAQLARQPDVAARIAGDLKSGRTIVIPARLEPGQELAGWWRIDPRTGMTLGVGPSGHGQAMVEYALIIIIETMMAAAQCALEASLTKALEKTLAEKAKGADSGAATGAGARAGFEQAKKDLGNTQTRNRCIAMGMFAGFRSLLIGFALHTVRTAGDKGYDGSKQTPSWERNANNNARNASNTARNAGNTAGNAASAGSNASGNSPSASPGGGRGNTQQASPGGPPPGTKPKGNSSDPTNTAKTPAPENLPQLKGEVGQRPVPKNVEASDIQKAKVEMEQAQQARDQARHKYDQAEDDFARNPRDPEALANKEIAQKALDDANREASYAQNRHTLSEAEQKAHDAAQAYAEQRDIMQQHINNGGNFSGPEYDAFSKASAANDAAHSDFMKARFGQLTPKAAPAAPKAIAPPGQAELENAKTAGMAGITSALGVVTQSGP